MSLFLAVVLFIPGIDGLQTNITAVAPGVATVYLDDSVGNTVGDTSETIPTLHAHASKRLVSMRSIPKSSLPNLQPFDTMFDDVDVLSVDPVDDPEEPAQSQMFSAPEDEVDEDEQPTEDEYHYRKVWNVVKGVRRHKQKRAKAKHQPAGVDIFFQSAVVYEWCIFATALGAFVVLHYHLLDWPSTTKFHATALIIWLALGGVYNAAVWFRLGKSAGVMWFTGYLLEFIFSIENVFVFHIVIKAFGAPRRVTQKALFVVVCCQVVFEMIFFMGLAARVRSIMVLPYVLGVWLLYVGFHAAQEGNYGNEDCDVKESSVFRLSKSILGHRLSPTYEESGSIFLIKGGTVCVSLLLPLILWLLAVDFLLEVDVTLTKIEELPNEYIAFTSSAAAAFAVPELFFVAQDLFQRYWLLQYGVSFVLMFFGVQMLFHRIYALPDLVGCGIIICVMLICMVASGMLRRSSPRASAYETNDKARKLCTHTGPDVPA